MNKFKNFIINFCSKIYSLLIIIELKLLNIHSKDKKIKFYYNHALGFGDSFTYYISKYSEIKKKNAFVLNFGYLTDLSSNFLFKKNKIKKINFFIYSFLPYYNIVNHIKKYKEFRPIGVSNYFKVFHIKNTNKRKKIILDHLKTKKIDQSLKILVNKRNYVCLYFKKNSNDINDLNHSNSRQTVDIKIINKILIFLKKKNTNLVIFGGKNERIIKELKNILDNKNKNVFFLSDIIKDYTLQDQIYAANKSKGYIGSSTGLAPFFYFLRKKQIVINVLDSKITRFYSHNHKYDSKLNVYLFKKIKLNNEKRFRNLKYNDIENIKNENLKYKIKEVTVKEIVQKINMQFFS